MMIVLLPLPGTRSKGDHVQTSLVLLRHVRLEAQKPFSEYVNECFAYLFSPNITPQIYGKRMVIRPNVIHGMALHIERVTPCKYGQYIPRHMEAMRIEGIWRKSLATSLDDRFRLYKPVIRSFPHLGNLRTRWGVSIIFTQSTSTQIVTRAVGNIEIPVSMIQPGRAARHMRDETVDVVDVSNESAGPPKIRAFTVGEGVGYFT